MNEFEELIREYIKVYYLMDLESITNKYVFATKRGKLYYISLTQLKKEIIWNYSGKRI